LLDRKDQLSANIDSGLLFLGSTDAALGGAEGVAGILSKIKADTLGVVGTIATDQQRQAAIADINGALDSLVALGNRQFNGRYVFAGSQRNAPPYTFENGNVHYQGDDGQIRNYSDIGVLFSSSISGQEVFGGISAAVEGKADLNPAINSGTLLSSLRDGRGINPNGSLQIANATQNELSIVDLSSATTIGDVIKLIEDNPPAGSEVNVSITSNGLKVELASGDNLSISEVGAGTTARELGLLATQDQDGDAFSVSSEDLNPQLLNTTRLDSLLGSQARATLSSVGENNDIQILANGNGSGLNGVSFEVIGTGAPSSVPVVTFNGATNTLEITVSSDGETTANEIVEAINTSGTLNVTASIEFGDASSGSDSGTGRVPFGTFGGIETAEGSGETLDTNSGIRIVNGGETHEITFTEDETLEDLLNTLNRSEAGVLAEINEAGTGINIRSRQSGNDFAIGENGGTTAAQLGIRTYDRDSQLSSFNFGAGVESKETTVVNLDTADVTITVSDTSSFTVDLSGAASINDAIIAINTDVNNDDGGGAPLVTAQLSADGNGIDFIDNTTGTQRLTVTQTGAPIAGLPDGVGVSIPVIDFHITTKDGTTLAIDVSGAQTVGDVLDLINNHTDNDDGGGNLLITARLNTFGNGIELVDSSGGLGDLTITRIDSNRAAEHLGLLERDTDTKSTSGAVDTLTGIDQNSLETDSVFNSLIRLRDALDDNNLPEIERAAALLDQDIDRVTFAQADVGTRFRNLELSKFNLQDERIQLQSALSDQIDVDLVEAISQLTARQTSLEASLRATANILQLSLINFI